MEPLIRVEGLKKVFPVRDSFFRSRELWAVNDVSFAILPGQAMGLVGESGCGKSTVGRCLVRLTQPSGGSVRFKGQEIGQIDDRAFWKYRKEIQMVFQDPTEALNPRMTVMQMIQEPLRLHTDLPESDQVDRVRELAALVALKEEHLFRYPHQLSTGQQQRVGVARSMATHPQFVVLDEPTSALDVSVRGLVIQLLMDLRERFGLSYLFISHDLSVIKHLCETVAVMYLGMVVETGPTRDVFSSPLHPYTRALLDAVPIPDPRKRRERITLTGEVPSPLNLPSGCFFASRCPYADDRCRSERQVLRASRSGRLVACHKVDEIQEGGASA